MNTRLAFLTIGLLLISAFGILVVSQASLDPLLEFRTKDGKLTIPGDKFTPELQRVLFPSPAPETYWTFAPEQSGYPTLNIIGTEYVYPSAVVSQEANLDIDVFGSLRSAFGQVVDFFFGSASAADRYLVLDDAGCTVTTIGTDAGCWSATTGGAGGAGVPVAADVVVMDASSGVGTGTLDASIDITTGTYNSTGFGGTFALATFNFSNTGTFTHAGGTITVSTGSLDVGAAAVSAAITASGAAGLLFDGLTISGNSIAKGTATLSIAGALTMSGGDLTSTSGAVSITGNVNISSAASAIDFGSETWTVSGTWTNVSTDAAWDAGTGSILFDSATGGTMTFAGANLAEAEFNSVTFTSSAGTAQTFTMATRDLRVAATLTVSDSSSTTQLTTAALGLQFVSLVIGTGGILSMDTISVTDIEFGTSSGDIALTEWTTYSVPAVSSADVAWTFNPSTAGATVTMILGGVQNGLVLYRDGDPISVQLATAGNIVTFAVTGGWSSHSMRILSQAVGGGTTPPPELPDGFPEEQPAAPSPAVISLYAAGIGALLFLSSQFLPGLKTSAKWKGRFTKVGLVLLVLGFSAWLLLQ